MTTKTRTQTPAQDLEAAIAEVLCTLKAVAVDLDETITGASMDASIMGEIVWKRDLLRRAYKRLLDAEYGVFHERCLREGTA